MLCLGIETSCDDTSLAVVENGRLLGQASASQADLHALFGGVVPELASREHARLIGPLLDCLIQDSGITLRQVDVVAVARGPGLLGSLLVGVAFAKALALGGKKGLIGVNHLHAHLLAAGLQMDIPFPALGLLVSGGHTHLYRVESPTAFQVLGKTLDDAAGEAFDKAGKMIGLPYPAGKVMDVLANEGRADPKLFPRPYLHSGDLDFSFSGLKTAMQAYLSAHPECRAGWDARSGRTILPEQGQARQAIADCCASYRLAVVDTLLGKTRSALDRPQNQDCRAIILAGGVAANTLLRDSISQLAGERGMSVCIPDFDLCTDNGAMIAYTGWLLARDGWRHSLSLEAIPRGRRIPEDMFSLAADCPSS